MSIGPTVVNIRKAYHALSGKLVDVVLTYKGPELGESNPWWARCDSYETKDQSEQGAADKLFKQIRDELQKKAATTELQAKQYRQALNSFEN